MTPLPAPGRRRSPGKPSPSYSPLVSSSQLAANLKILTKTESPWRQRQLDWQLGTKIVDGCAFRPRSIAGRLEEPRSAFLEHAAECSQRQAVVTCGER